MNKSLGKLIKKTEGNEHIQHLKCQRRNSHPVLSIFILFIYLFIYLFWPHRVACRILVLRPGTEPGSSAVKAPSPNHWTVREFLRNSHIIKEKFQDS